MIVKITDYHYIGPFLDGFLLYLPDIMYSTAAAMVFTSPRIVPTMLTMTAIKTNINPITGNGAEMRIAPEIISALDDVGLLKRPVA